MEKIVLKNTAEWSVKKTSETSAMLVSTPLNQRSLLQLSVIPWCAP